MAAAEFLLGSSGGSAKWAGRGAVALRVVGKWTERYNHYGATLFWWAQVAGIKFCALDHPAPSRSHPSPKYTTNALYQQASTSKPTGPHRIIYTTAPRPLIPLTTSPANHLLWNPPAADAKGSRVVERDESGRLARFASRFAGVGGIDGEGEEGENKSQFMPEADLSFLEGETLQSPVKALGKKDIVYVFVTSRDSWPVILAELTFLTCFTAVFPRRRRERSSCSY